ncbi:location of vulva defective 1-like [Hyposmocoma kahamanoa]|uniref:location of vulva defective 1-like n=1 Tax=Hyposmocoma kahamanoa TaxID=1477025 RepID=UPI000E6D6ACD|nr:location of vulva defective 1-like [Hyposmocoma kahamanoa]
MSSATSTFVIVNIQVTCLIIHSITTSGAFHERYSTKWPYNYFNSNWQQRYIPQYTVGLVQPLQDENSYSSSSGSSSLENSSNSASISNPSTEHKKTNYKKKYQNNCKCSCEDCDRLMSLIDERVQDCCKDKCKRCLLKSTTRKSKTMTYMILPYVVPIMFSMKINPITSSATTTTSTTLEHTTSTTTSRTTTTTTPTTTTTTITTKTTTTPTSTTTTTPSTSTTTPTSTTTTTPRTTTSTPTSTTTSTTTTTTTPTTTTTTSSTTSSTEPPIPFTLRTFSTYVIPEESPSYPVRDVSADITILFPEENDSKKDDDEENDSKKDDGEENDVTAYFSPQKNDMYYYVDDTTTTARSSWQDHDYHYYEEYTTSTRPNKKCEIPKCVRNKKKLYYYARKQVATTEQPFLMPTRAIPARKSYSTVDNELYNDETVKDYYNMVYDEKMNYAREYYYDDYYYYTDKVDYNEISVELSANF